MPANRRLAVAGIEGPLWQLAPRLRSGKDWRTPPMKAFVYALLIPAFAPTLAECRSPVDAPSRVSTKLRRSTEAAGYVLDTLELPEAHPGGPPLDVGGFDFFSDGRLALGTAGGDVWVAHGIDSDVIQWRRFATGLRGVAGLKVVSGGVYVASSEGIVRLRDPDTGGGLDSQEVAKNGIPPLRGVLSDLQADATGNLYSAAGKVVVKKGNASGRASLERSVLRFRADGSGWEAFFTGKHAPTGIALSPNGALTYAERGAVWAPGTEIEWAPTSVPENAQAPGAKPERQWDTPLCWIPSQWADSAGGLAWVPSERWGPWKDQLLLFRDGNTALLGLLREEVRGRVQGGLLAFPLRFPGGILRGRFNPADGQLYVSGRRVSSSGGGKSSWLQRVRYTGAPVLMPVEFRAERKGITLRFGCDLDTETAADPGHYRLEILHEAPHGAPADGEGSPRKTTPEGGGSGTRRLAPERSPSLERSVLRVESVSVGTDDKTVFLEVPVLQPPLRMRLSYTLKTVEGLELKGELFPTVHALGESD